MNEIFCVTFLLLFLPALHGKSWFLSFDEVENRDSLTVSIKNAFFVAGKRNKAVELKSTSLVTVENWANANDCPISPKDCERGLTLSFWMMLNNLNGSKVDILSTTGLNSKGFRIAYSNTNNSITASIQTGEKYFETDEHSLTECSMKWCHILVVWNKVAQTYLLAVDKKIVNNGSVFETVVRTTSGSNLSIGKNISSGFLYIDEIYIQDNVYKEQNFDIFYGK